MKLASAGQRRILLTPVVNNRDADLPIAALAAELKLRLRMACPITAPLKLDAAWYDPEREQYSSNAIVDALVHRFEDERYDLSDSWMLGVTNADLYAADRTFVFGEATLGGCCALVSTARLDGRADRLVIEAIHELGHVAGLEHCGTFECVMAPSPDVVAIDSKTPDLCERCVASLRQA